MDQYLSSARLLLQPIAAALSQLLGSTHADTELILISSFITLLLSVFFLSTLPRSGRVVSEPCCVTKLMQKRKAAKLPGEQIPSSIAGSPASPNLEAFIRDVQQQLVSIRNEIQSLKSEREIVDHELIETSTQILQTIGATFGPVLEENDTELELPKIVKPIPNRPNVERPVIELTPAKHQSPLINPSIQHDSPVTQKSTSLVKPLILPNPEPRAPQSKAPVVPAASQPKAPSQVNAAPTQQPKPVVPVPNSAPASIKPEPAPAQVNPAPKVAPKMSAIAAARLKREQELSESKAPPAQPGATNPFGKPKPGPFGGPALAKLS
jgi:hypothetical protein